MSEEFETLEELTIEEVTEYAEEFGFQLLIHGDTFALNCQGRVMAVGTLDELVQVIEVSEEFAVLTELYSPTGLTIH